MTNHPNRSKATRGGFAILLNTGHLWKSLGAASAAIFQHRADAEPTLAGLSGRGALANAIIVSVVSGTTEGRRLVDGYFVL